MDETELGIFKKYLPEKSVVYCHRLWKDHQVQLTITRPRKTVYGNYIYRQGIHHITVNGDLSPESFLVTYLHEVAHLLVRKAARTRVKPHGPEWQQAFRQVMKPMLDDKVFGPELSEALARHLQKPTATSCADPVMHRLLQGDRHQPLAPHEAHVHHLAVGDRFQFRHQVYTIARKVRTRIECIREGDGAVYRFQPTAKVLRVNGHA